MVAYSTTVGISTANLPIALPVCTYLPVNDSIQLRPLVFGACDDLQCVMPSSSPTHRLSQSVGDIACGHSAEYVFGIVGKREAILAMRRRKTANGLLVRRHFSPRLRILSWVASGSFSWVH